MKILDYIEQKELQQIQDLFSASTGLAAIAVDQEGSYITEGSNFTDFCMKYTRNTELGKARCEKCDAECTGTYFCHAGLMDFSEDIIINGEKVGAIIGGQVLPNPPEIEKFENIAKELGIPVEKYIGALSKVPIKTEKSIRASAKLLGEVVNTIVNMEYLKRVDEDSLKILNEEIASAFACSENITSRSRNLQSIASKQNILALNASIEAARYGQEGAGFTVVATEMGKLSKNSGDIYDGIRENAELLHQSITKMKEALKK